MPNIHSAISTVSVLLLIGLSMTANDADAAEVWISQTRITNLYPTSTSLFFVTEYAMPLSTCDNGSRFEIPMSTPNYNVLASALFAAFHSGHPIRMNFDDAPGPRCDVVINRFFVDE
ncbi:MAG: hypothetical protein AAF290_16385 [Pseudomonadota bacterium]